MYDIHINTAFYIAPQVSERNGGGSDTRMHKRRGIEKSRSTCISETHSALTFLSLSIEQITMTLFF